ncbi:hypothetical protein [Nocardia sp. NPDC059239]|uniref:hypothetical protein n=1 Tax=Nocardia sp. NPDC059239 TaxID=3346785 RepID=UPI0036CA92C2
MGEVMNDELPQCVPGTHFNLPVTPVEQPPAELLERLVAAVELWARDAAAT